MLVQYHSPIGKASYDTVCDRNTYSSYWIDCIDRILETRMFFSQEEFDIGYYSCYDDIRYIQESEEEINSKLEVFSKDEVDAGLIIQSMEIKLFHDLVEEGKDILKIKECVDESQIMFNFEPYIYSDPEYTQLVQEFCNKALEIRELTDECHHCIRAHLISKNCPFYEKDLHYPDLKDNQTIYEKMLQQDQENFTAAKAMIFDEIKKPFEAIQDEIMTKLKIKESFFKLNKIENENEITDGQNQTLDTLPLNKSKKANMIDLLVRKTKEDINQVEEQKKDLYTTNEFSEFLLKANNYSILINRTDGFSNPTAFVKQQIVCDQN